MRLASLAVLLGGWAVWYTYLPWMAGGAPNFSPSVIFAYVLYTLLAPTILFAIIWPVHKAMRRYKHDLQKEIAQALEREFVALSVLGKGTSKQTVSLERFQQLEFLSNQLEKMPEWPIDSFRLKRFLGIASLPGSAGMFSYLTELLSLSTGIGHFFANFLSLFTTK